MYHWPLIRQFVGREPELERMERWWHSDSREPMSVYGRRRVGKSWLLHRLAHGKPAVLLVASQLAVSQQLRGFGDQLAEAGLLGGVAPAIEDVPHLVRLLFTAAREDKLLVVIDEFPYLLGSTSADQQATLSGIQAVLETERDVSALKLVMCGSSLATMDTLQHEKNPLHGRLQSLQIQPMPLTQARQILQGTVDPLDAFTRFAIAGGMPRYLRALGDGSLDEALAREVLSPHAPLWDEGTAIISQELREPAMYNSVLSALAGGDKEAGEIAGHIGSSTTTLQRYLQQLERLRLVDRELPYGAPPNAKGQLWSLRDPFLRFWFRFVSPFHHALDEGLPPQTHLLTEVHPGLASHVGAVFEEQCRRHTLAGEFGVTSVGRWWGNAVNELRRSGERTSEELDVVAGARGKVQLVGECKWTAKPVGLKVLGDVEQYKLPALRQAGIGVVKNPMVVLFGKSGYDDSLHERAAEDPMVILTDVPSMLGGTRAEGPAWMDRSVR